LAHILIAPTTASPHFGGGPVGVGGNFSCNDNNLQHFNFCPERVGGHFFSCHNNPALQGAQQITDFLDIRALHTAYAVIEEEKSQLNQHILAKDGKNQIHKI